MSESQKMKTRKQLNTGVSVAFYGCLALLVAHLVIAGLEVATGEDTSALGTNIMGVAIAALLLGNFFHIRHEIKMYVRLEREDAKYSRATTQIRRLEEERARLFADRQKLEQQLYDLNFRGGPSEAEIEANRERASRAAGKNRAKCQLAGKPTWEEVKRVKAAGPPVPDPSESYLQGWHDKVDNYMADLERDEQCEVEEKTLAEKAKQQKLLGLRNKGIRLAKQRLKADNPNMKRTREIMAEISHDFKEGPLKVGYMDTLISRCVDLAEPTEPQVVVEKTWRAVEPDDAPKQEKAPEKAPAPEEHPNYKTGTDTGNY